MDKKSRKKGKLQVTQIRRLSNPEFTPIGVAPPESGELPCSVSPVAGSLHAFVESQGDSVSSSGGVSIRLAEFMGGRNRRHGQARMARKGGKKDAIGEDTTLSSESSKQLEEVCEEPQEQMDQLLEEAVNDKDPKRDSVSAASSRCGSSAAEVLDQLQLESSSEEEDGQPQAQPEKVHEQPPQVPSNEKPSSSHSAEPSSPHSAEPSSSHSAEPSSSHSAEDFQTALLRILQEQIQAADAQGDFSQNKQEQDDEILALEAIYEDKLTRLIPGDDLSGSQFFMISVPVEIPDSIRVFMDQSTSSTASSSEATRTSASYSFSLEHLPPIYLAVAYSNGYPTQEAPLFVLYCRWMNTEQLMQLSEQLDELWSSQVGEVVLYAWVEFLRSQTLSTIGDADTLVLKISNQNGNSRVLSHFTTAEAEAVFLLAYNEEMQVESFKQSYHTCDICFTEYPGKDFIKLPCEHFYCRICMEQYALVHIQEGSVNRLKCPNTACRGPFPPHLLKEVVDPEAFQRWEKFSLQKVLDAMPDLVYCPRCELPCIEHADHLAQCGSCFFHFCSFCRQGSHIGRECLSMEDRLLILEERSKKGGGRRMESELMNEILNMRAVKRDSKQCPACRMAISKTEGCNKMVCTNCGVKFCFICCQAIHGYDHYQNGCCALFDPDDIVAWEAQMNPQRVPVRLPRQGVLHPENPKLCPACRQPNAKRGNNNHMFCWACQNHYCALCSKLVRRATEHFGPNKCKQHTAD